MPDFDGRVRMSLRQAAPYCRLLCVLLLLAGFGSGLTGCRTKSFLSTRQEVNLGKEGARQVEQELTVDISSPDAERVRAIGRKLLDHMDKRDVPYTFKVVDAREINAFSLPGGPIYVYRGLLDMLGDDDAALACILGHEAAHINARHAARQLSSNIFNNILIGVLIPNPTARNAAGLGSELVGLKYSRDDEYEADRRGLSYAHYAGYDTNGMIRFFEKLQRMEKRTGSGPPEWLRTHPVTRARIEKAKTIIERQDYRYGH